MNEDKATTEAASSSAKASQYRYVYRKGYSYGSRKIWYSFIRFARQNVHLGTYRTELEAAQASDAAIIMLYPDPSTYKFNLNFAEPPSEEIVLRVKEILERKELLNAPTTSASQEPTTVQFPTPAASPITYAYTHDSKSQRISSSRSYESKHRIASLRATLRKIFEDFDKEELNLLGPDYCHYYNSLRDESSTTPSIQSASSAHRIYEVEEQESTLSMQPREENLDECLQRIFEGRTEEEINELLDDSAFDPTEPQHVRYRYNHKL